MKPNKTLCNYYNSKINKLTIQKIKKLYFYKGIKEKTTNKLYKRNKTKPNKITLKGGDIIFKDESSGGKVPSAIRYKEIIDLLRREKTVSVTTLSSIFKVSEVTIRKDLEKLENDGLLIRSHGGAVLNEKLETEPSFGEKEDIYIEEKVSIAAEAAKLITDNMTIALNAGTTTTHIARKIRDRKNLNVVTNAINIAWDLMSAPGVNVFLTGGNLRSKSYALVGKMEQQSLHGIFVDMAFIGVNGVDLKQGLTTPNIDEALANQSIIEAANKLVIVADHSKFNCVTFSLITTIDKIDVLITDPKAPEDQLQTLQNMGKTIITSN